MRDALIDKPTPTPILAPSNVLVVATVDGTAPAPDGIDWVRIDGAVGTLRAMASRRDACTQPVLFDVPGPGVRQRGALLTTSEFLVFAAAEGFEWVNLRGVHDPEEILYAREFLPTSVRVSATLDSQRAIRLGLDPLCSVADAILLDRRALRHSLGARRADALVGASVRHASERGTPALLASDVLPSMVRTERPHERDMARLCDLVDDGLRGLILTDEVLDAADPRGPIDVARLVAQQGGDGPARIHEARPAARVAGRACVVPSCAGDEGGYATP